MYVDRIALPKDKSDLAKVIDIHSQRERTKMVVRHTMWRLMALYAAGARQFKQFDLKSGELTYEWTDKEGNLEYQASDLLYAANQIAGQLAGSDNRCKVEAEGQSLFSIRNAAVARVIGDALFGENEVNAKSRDFAWLYTYLGSAGICGHVLDHPVTSIGLTGDLEVIHPRELFPFPSLDEDYTKAFGMMRERPVSMDHLRNCFGNALIGRNQDKMFWERRIMGETPLGNNVNNLPAGIQVKYNNGQGVPLDGQEEISEGYAVVRELWLNGERGTCSRYIVTSGEAVLLDENYEKVKVEKYCPIGRQKFMDNQTWYGAGVFDLMFSISRHLELLMKSLFNNIRDIDRYGFLVLPSGVYNEKSVMKDMGHGLRALFVESDALGGDVFRPFSVTPHNTGDVPGKTAAFAQQYLASLNPIRDILKEKGRVDSAQGLAFLDESARRALSNPTAGLQAAFGQCYKAGVSNAVSKLTESPRALPITNVTLDLCGAVIDWKENKLTFRENPIPSVSRLKFTTKEANPKSEVASIQMGMQMVQDQLVAPEAFLIKAVQEGWDLPVWQEDMKSGVATAIRAILTLYGDGVSPGELVLAPYMVRPDIFLAILSAFMSDVPMMVASVDVQNEFNQLKQQVTEWSGRILPEQLPANPDDIAVVQQGMQGAAGMMANAQGNPNARSY